MPSHRYCRPSGVAGVVVEEGDNGVLHGGADLVGGGVLLEVDGLLVGEMEGQALDGRKLLMRAEWVLISSVSAESTRMVARSVPARDG